FHVLIAVHTDREDIEAGQAFQLLLIDLDGIRLRFRLDHAALVLSRDHDGVVRLGQLEAACDLALAVEAAGAVIGLHHRVIDPPADPADPAAAVDDAGGHVDFDDGSLTAILLYGLFANRGVDDLHLGRDPALDDAVHVDFSRGGPHLAIQIAGEL